MLKRRYSALVLAGLTASANLAACRAASPTPAATENVKAMEYSGTITVEGQPVGRADVVLLDRAGAWLGTAPVEDGRFHVASDGATKLLVRLYDPVVGMLVRDVPAPGRYDFAVASDDIATVRGAVSVPASMSFDWVELHVNPVSSDDVPQNAVVEPGKSFFFTDKLSTPEFTLRVLRSSYYVWASKLVDGPATLDGPRSLENDVITAEGSVTATPAFRGAEVAVAGDGALAIAMKILTD